MTDANGSCPAFYLALDQRIPAISPHDGRIEALILDVETSSVHDGAGPHTTVFMKGCPLRCVWCHVPESQSSRPERGFLPDGCVEGCDACIRACPHRVLEASAKGASPAKGNGAVRTITINRQRCSLCGTCVKACPTGAMVLIGETRTVDDVFAEVSRTARTAPGKASVILTGGEPLAQWTFVRALLARCREHGIRATLDTCGHGPWDHLRTLLALTDLLRYDVKVIDSARHARFTGVPNDLVLDNLRRASDLGVPIEISVPLIAGYTASREDVAAVGDLARGLSSVVQIELVPHHPLAATKYRSLDRGDRLAGFGAPADDDIVGFRRLLEDMGHRVRIRGERPHAGKEQAGDASRRAQ